MSLNKLGIKFDLFGMLSDLESKLKFTIDNIADEIVAELNAKDFKFATGTFKKELVETSEEFVKYKVGSTHWYSWLVNYGKGSKMELDNPFLNDYMADEVLWNEARDKADKIIRPRPRGYHVVPDWEGGTGTTVIHGSNNTNFDLEKYGGEKYKPFPGNTALDDAIKSAGERMIPAINEAFRTFPFSDYIKGGG